MSDSLWDEDRAKRYLELYHDPREKKGTQSLLCRDISNYIPKGVEDVLDIGCGMGHLVPYVIPEGSPVKTDYYGFDYSPTMLKYLKEFFPYVQTMQGDATLPLKEFNNELMYSFGKNYFDIVTSVSLFIHIPTLEQVERLLKNMYSTCTKAMVFCVETAGSKKTVREDGLTLRNIPIDWVNDQLRKLGAKPQHITYSHQKLTYQQFYSVIPTLPQPLQVDPPKLFTRTTIFRVKKA